MRIGFGVGPQQKLTVEDIQRAVIALPVVDVFDGHLNAQVLSAPYVATRIAPQEVTLIYEEGTELAFLYRGPVVDQFFLFPLGSGLPARDRLWDYGPASFSSCNGLGLTTHSSSATT